ncbi:uncharacterized protein LOC131144394 [Malania oleifera]|uniref:uncharacterized protein LOC131144394 n=1 Tax=Malania oleifera TaxID=397392 RepID=UPI0025AE0136|nr:uncharacterized protein LOC131144394 [Malania oleifera]XP_057949007.1 uncharacterized protein LOC131144394 [Malania oleifera]
MPSGSKKRKAAKKKKEKRANINSSANTSHGNNGLKLRDEKESDGGEVGSPASQDHQHHERPFGEAAGEEDKTDTSSVQSFASENKSMEEASQDKGGEGVVDVVPQLKPEESSKRQNISIEYVELEKESHDEGSFGDDGGTSRDDGGTSSSSSSDDERKWKDDASNSVLETTPPDASVMAEVVDVARKSKDDSYNSVLETTPADASVMTEVVDVVPPGEACNVVLETGPLAESTKPAHSLPEEAAFDTKIIPVPNLKVSDGVDTSSKEHEKLLPSLHEVTADSLTTIDSTSKKHDDKVFPLSNENVRVSSISSGVVSASADNEDKLLPPSDVPSVGVGDGAEPTQGSEETPECSENQPLVASAPRSEQTTFWKSCCGLFDVLTGSNR